MSRSVGKKRGFLVRDDLEEEEAFPGGGTISVHKDLVSRRECRRSPKRGGGKVCVSEKTGFPDKEQRMIPNLDARAPPAWKVPHRQPAQKRGKKKHRNGKSLGIGERALHGEEGRSRQRLGPRGYGTRKRRKLPPTPWVYIKRPPVGNALFSYLPTQFSEEGFGQFQDEGRNPYYRWLQNVHRKPSSITRSMPFWETAKGCRLGGKAISCSEGGGDFIGGGSSFLVL